MAQKMFLPSVKWKILSENKCQPFKFDNVTFQVRRVLFEIWNKFMEIYLKNVVSAKKKKKKKKKDKYSDWFSLSFYMGVNPPSLVMKTKVLGQ